MTVEQRERHLARRRRNYQLRRLRAENAKVDFQSNQISNEHEADAAAVSDVHESDISTEPLQCESLFVSVLNISISLTAIINYFYMKFFGQLWMLWLVKLLI